MSQVDIQATLAGLTRNEHQVLTTIFHFFAQWNYRTVSDHDLYAAIPHVDYEHVHAALVALREKQFIEMDNYIVTNIVMLHHLSEQERHVLVTIVDFDV